MNLDAFLVHHGIRAERVEHPAVMTVEESERLVPPLPGAKTKNLFLRDKKGLKHLLVTVPSARAVDLNRLGEVLGVGRLGFASAERLSRHLGITPGSVSLLALLNDTAHKVDFVIAFEVTEDILIERLLHRAERTVGRADALDGGDVGAVGLHREQQT
jgi:Ala-tRNA(Pro) deacylase